MLNAMKAVIFDLDGTLMDSMWMWRDIDIEYLGRYGYEPPANIERDIEGMSFTETAVYFQKRFALPCSIEEIKKVWRDMALEKYAKEVRLKPGAEGFLAYLRETGIRIGIASSNTRDLIDACLAGNGIAGYIDQIITSCEVAKGKPAPDVYLQAASLLGVRPDHCLVFEDVPMGILAGKNAGMRVCAVRDAFSEPLTEEIRALADYYITTYDEILAGTYEILGGKSVRSGVARKEELL